MFYNITHRFLYFYVMFEASKVYNLFFRKYRTESLIFGRLLSDCILFRTDQTSLSEL